MKRQMMLALVGAVALASCNMNRAPDVTGTTRKANFTPQLNTTAGSGYTAAAGTVDYVDITGGDRRTVLTMTGLKPGVSYVAHYHARGAAAPAGTNDCASNGPIVGEPQMIGMAMTASGTGTLTLKGLQATSTLSSAAYINVHEANALAVVPLCADI
ncbi:hypothetical protein [Deinococcus multiflagellatus]|uniref:Superoxide dismutase n=1 Tax=Deinococcus multiflagellatus TaxID=1656887 RepID=A0ABW1ZLX2_9DEIO|nr:hypothetical protein [Deinococcus multiflagellatus]MBZ9712491.1 hypothetical protein [Deinococcus multiflagellatus]